MLRGRLNVATPGPHFTPSYTCAPASACRPALVGASPHMSLSYMTTAPACPHPHPPCPLSLSRPAPFPTPRARMATRPCIKPRRAATPPASELSWTARRQWMCTQQTAARRCTARLPTVCTDLGLRGQPGGPLEGLGPPAWFVAPSLQPPACKPHSVGHVGCTPPLKQHDPSAAHCPSAQDTERHVPRCWQAAPLLTQSLPSG